MQADSRRKRGYRNSHSSHSANSTQLVARALRRKNQLKILLLLTRHELRARRSEDGKVNGWRGKSRRMQKKKSLVSLFERDASNVILREKRESP